MYTMIETRGGMPQEVIERFPSLSDALTYSDMRNRLDFTPAYRFHAGHEYRVWNVALGCWEA